MLRSRVRLATISRRPITRPASLTIGCAFRAAGSGRKQTGLWFARRCRVAAPSYSAPAPSAPAPSTPAAVGPQPNYSTAPKVVTVEIQTPDGAVSVAMPEEYIPGTADHDLTPARVRIPNIWDSLDPTKTSQFAYRGLARSLPVWISKDWRETLSAAAAPAAPAVDPLAAAAEMPFLAFVAIGAACWMLRDKKGKR